MTRTIKIYNNLFFHKYVDMTTLEIFIYAQTDCKKRYLCSIAGCSQFCLLNVLHKFRKLSNAFDPAEFRRLSYTQCITLL